MTDGARRADDLVAGTVLDDRYLIEAMLGRGGMGVVYRGEHLTVGRPVAVKVLAAEWIEHGDVAQRFRAEARAASAAGHPNIIEVLDAGALPDGRPYLVTELISGRDLFQVLEEDGPLDVVRACHIGLGVARALDAAHGEGIVHRDLKLENVMVARHGEQEVVKVLDFGIAADTAAPGRRRTVEGKVLGTPGAMAPEQAAGQRATPAFDIYALGVVMYEILTGQGPFEGQTAQGMMLAKMDVDAPSIATRRSGLPGELVSVIDECLARDPRARPSSAQLVARRLQAIVRMLESDGSARLSTEVAHAPASPLPVPPPSPRSGRRWWIGAALGLVALSLVGLGAWAAGPGLETPPQSAAASEADASASEPPAPVIEAPPPAVAVPGVEVVAAPTPEPAPVADPGESSPNPAVAERPSSPDPEPAETEPAEIEPPAKAERPPLPPPPEDMEPPSTSEGSARPADCQRTRKQARQARQDSDWTGMLRHTSVRGCWQDARTERKILRTKAFMELRRWDDCIAAGQGLSGSEPESWVQLCERRKERG